MVRDYFVVDSLYDLSKFKEVIMNFSNCDGMQEVNVVLVHYKNAQQRLDN